MMPPTTPVRYNAGHSRHAFATRVRMLRQHPEIWRQMPNGITVADFRRGGAERQLWIEIVDFLRSCGLVSESTTPIDVNVPKLIAAVRAVERPRWSIVPLPPEVCDRGKCHAPATHEVHNGDGRFVGRYCQPCAQLVVDAARR